jgi:hypothetical protein
MVSVRVDCPGPAWARIVSRSPGPATGSHIVNRGPSSPTGTAAAGRREEKEEDAAGTREEKEEEGEAAAGRGGEGRRIYSYSIIASAVFASGFQASVSYYIFWPRTRRRGSRGSGPPPPPTDSTLTRNPVAAAVLRTTRCTRRYSKIAGALAR